MNDIKEMSSDYFSKVQKSAVNFIKTVDSKVIESIDKWDYKSEKSKSGGGKSIILRGEVIEKAAVNFSKLSGKFSSDAFNIIKGTKESAGDFWASGVSIIIHPKNPYHPTLHFNERLVITNKATYGGGFDINPMIEKNFKSERESLFKAMDNQDFGVAKDTLEGWKKKADDYFFIKHRSRPRSAGGIFFEYLDANESNFKILQKVADFCFNYYQGVFERKEKAVSSAILQEQLKLRGFYAEFNLVQDRGTKFGLLSNGNVNAILGSLPPVATWT